MKAVIVSEIEKVAQEHKIALRPLDDKLVLADSGLDSLCFAILVARLEDKLGIDPFVASDEVSFPVTLGDFIVIYEKAKVAA